MYEIHVTPPAVLGFLIATSQHKPKGTTEFYDATQIAKGLKPLYEERANGERVNLFSTIPVDETRPLVLETSAFRLLKSAFEGARDSGTVFNFAQAEMVVEAERCLKGAETRFEDAKKKSAETK